MLKVKLLAAIVIAILVFTALSIPSAKACTINSPTVNFGVIQNGQVTVSPVSLSLNCLNGAPWALTSPISNQLVVGADTISNQSRIETLSSTTIDTAGVAGTGTGAAQPVNLQIRLSSTGLTGIVGAGALSGSIPLTITY